MDLQALLNYLMNLRRQYTAINFRSQPLNQILQLPSLNYQLQNRNLYNDLGQKYMPGFWQGNWADLIGQTIEDQSNLIMNQIGPLLIKNRFRGPQKQIIPDLSNILRSI